MRKSSLTILIPVGIALMGMASCNVEQKWTEKQIDNFMLVSQEDGPTLGYTPESGVKLLTIDGFAFKDLNRNDSLDAYEDWRLPAKKRAADLASKLSLEEIAGLMLYSSHQTIPSKELTADQKKFLKDDHLRAILITRVESPIVAAQWNNQLQYFVESLDHGIPAVFDNSDLAGILLNVRQCFHQDGGPLRIGDIHIVLSSQVL